MFTSAPIDTFVPDGIPTEAIWGALHERLIQEYQQVLAGGTLLDILVVTKGKSDLVGHRVGVNPDRIIAMGCQIQSLRPATAEEIRSNTIPGAPGSVPPPHSEAAPPEWEGPPVGAEVT